MNARKDPSLVSHIWLASGWIAGSGRVKVPLRYFETATLALRSVKCRLHSIQFPSPRSRINVEGQDGSATRHSVKVILLGPWVALEGVLVFAAVGAFAPVPPELPEGVGVVPEGGGLLLPGFAGETPVPDDMIKEDFWG